MRFFLPRSVFDISKTSVREVELLKGLSTVTVYFELFWRSIKLSLNWRKPENRSLLKIEKQQRVNNNKQIKRKRMVKDEEDYDRLQTANLKNLG